MRRSGTAETVGWPPSAPGPRLIDVYSGLAQQGCFHPRRLVPDGGIAGLALGGGIGVMDRLCTASRRDNIVGLKLVTAAGDIVTADAATNADLYWACRGGGGGNFGMVTEFRFSTFPVTEIGLFFATWPW